MGRTIQARWVEKICLLSALCVGVLAKTLSRSSAYPYHARGLLPGAIQPRIVGGRDTARHEYPFFVRMDIDYMPSCGASLVSPEVVLTAAHCSAASLASINLLVNGYHDNFLFNDDQEFRWPVENRSHPLFDSSTFHNDMALLKLNEPVTNLPYVELSRNDSEPRSADTVVVMGLGALVEGGGYPEILQAAEVRVMNHTDCNIVYSDLGVPIIDGIQLCAGTREGIRDSCHGDSGGPLINHRGEQIGLVSYGYGCARKGFPGIYSRTMVRDGYDDWLGYNVCDMTSVANRPDWCADVIGVLSVESALIAAVDPTAAPTKEPTTAPTAEPTSPPTVTPTALPTQSPTNPPTQAPTSPPTESPTTSPTESPTVSPTDYPTPSPTASPTEAPTLEPTVQPTQAPTPEPTSATSPSEAATVTVTPDTTPEPTPGCGAGTYHTANGYEFCQFGPGLSYVEAKSNCSSLGLQLIQIQTEAKQDAVKTFCGYDCTWLLLTCPSEDRSLCDTNFAAWEWGDGIPLNETFNAMTKANDGTITGGTTGEFCGHWWRSNGLGLWAPHSCGNNRHYGAVCENATQAHS